MTLRGARPRRITSVQSSRRALWLPVAAVATLAAVLAGALALRSAASGSHGHHQATNAAAAGVVAFARSPAQRVRLGTRWLTRCGVRPLAYCGRERLPLDYGVASSPRIVIAYRWYPATDRRRAPAGTVVPVEGGPGYSSIASAPEYRVMYGSLLRRWNLLSVDNRGTGNSTALDCPAVQHFTQSTVSPSFGRAVAACASSLNHRWRYANGTWVHASDLFTSALAARDLAGVIAALGLHRIDVYGDSYGSYFAQLFASLYPHLVRSVTLDSTYPVIASDPWYRSSIRDMPHDFNVVCSRSPACRAAAPGSSWSRLRELAGVLRRHPATADVPGYNGTVHHVRMTVTGLVDLLSDAAGDPAVYQQIDAAARALLDHRDPGPLLRLYDQRLSYDEAYSSATAAEDSATLYLAVACLDYRQLFDTSAPPGVRSAQFAHALATLPASTFGPFTTAEWVAMDQNTETYSACLQWPSRRHATTRALPRPLLPASTPVLVLGGELDTWTPPSDVVGAVLGKLGGHSRFVELLNSTHVVGEGDTGCASRLVRAFVSRPTAIDAIQAQCAQTIPPIRTVGAYPERLAQQVPVVPLTRHQCDPPAAAARRRRDRDRGGRGETERGDQRLPRSRTPRRHRPGQRQRHPAHARP